MSKTQSNSHRIGEAIIAGVILGLFVAVFITMHIIRCVRRQRQSRVVNTRAKRVHIPYRVPVQHSNSAALNDFPPRSHLSSPPHQFSPGPSALAPDFFVPFDDATRVWDDSGLESQYGRTAPLPLAHLHPPAGPASPPATAGSGATAAEIAELPLLIERLNTIMAKLPPEGVAEERPPRYER